MNLSPLLARVEDSILQASLAHVQGMIPNPGFSGEGIAQLLEIVSHQRLELTQLMGQKLFFPTSNRGEGSLLQVLLEGGQGGLHRSDAGALNTLIVEIAVQKRAQFCQRF